MSFGVQTFTVRREQKKDIEAAYLALREMGVSSLEIARIDFSEKNARKIRDVAEKHGIRPVSIQVKPKYVIKDPDSVIAFCRITGCKNVVISMLPFSCILGGEERFYSFVSMLDGLCERYEREGITLAYHHHNWEYVKLKNGKTRMEELLERTERIRFVHDTYWAAQCGIEPAKQVRQFGKRLLGVHLRDLAFKKRGLRVIPANTYVGGGVIDFEGVILAAKEAGCEYMVIEQNTVTPYENIGRSLENLNKIRTRIDEKQYQDNE